MAFDLSQPNIAFMRPIWAFGLSSCVVSDKISMHQRGGDEYDDRDYTYRIDRNRRWT